MKRMIKVSINNHTWSVRRLSPEDMNWAKCQMYGYTWVQHKAIDILDTLEEKDLPLVIRHEVCHALLDTQGRRYQQKFDVEELCEFVAWNMEEITRITDEIYLKLTDKKGS